MRLQKKNQNVPTISISPRKGHVDSFTRKLVHTSKDKKRLPSPTGFDGKELWCSYHEEPLDTLTSSACGTNCQSLVFSGKCASLCKQLRLSHKL